MLKTIVLFYFLYVSALQASSLRILENDSWYNDCYAQKDQKCIDNKKFNQNIKIEQLYFGARHLGIIDIRGVGDSACIRNCTGDTFKKYLEPLNKYIKGDLNFINWESVVGTTEETIARTGPSYHFLSHPDSLAGLQSFGFNLISLANNHSNDYTSFDRKLNGALVTAKNLKKLDHPQILMAGVEEFQPGDAYEFKEKVLNIKEEDVNVAFSSTTLVSWDMPRQVSHINWTKNNEVKNYLDNILKLNIQNLQNDQLKFLSVHTEDGSGHFKEEMEGIRQAKYVAKVFIQSGGNIVFKHGPHTWAGVKVMKNKTGQRSVIVAGLGNFLHEGLASNGENYIARILLSAKNHELIGLQLIPYRNQKTTISFNQENFRKEGCEKMIPSNFYWKDIEVEGVFTCVAMFDNL